MSMRKRTMWWWYMLMRFGCRRGMALDETIYKDCFWNIRASDHNGDGFLNKQEYDNFVNLSYSAHHPPCDFRSDESFSLAQTMTFHTLACQWCLPDDVCCIGENGRIPISKSALRESRLPESFWMDVCDYTKFVVVAHCKDSNTPATSNATSINLDENDDSSLKNILVLGMAGMILALLILLGILACVIYRRRCRCVEEEAFETNTGMDDDGIVSSKDSYNGVVIIEPL